MSKLIVITGVSRGLGLAMTEGFVQAGHTVVGCARSETAVEKLRQQYNSPHDFAVVDVADNQQVQTWAEQVLSRHGVPDLLINNAAIINPLAPLWQIPVEECDRLIDV
ncbi:MAG: SDR family oxidoreductase, partial [Xenococcaceae cyanobacterium]